MKIIAHVGAAANSQNKAVVVELAKQVVAAIKADVHACVVCVVLVAVCCVETHIVDWRCCRRCQQHVQHVDASVGFEQRVVSVSFSTQLLPPLFLPLCTEPSNLDAREDDKNRSRPPQLSAISQVAYAS